MKIVIYKENKPEKGDYDYLIEFPKETSVISLEETIQILFVLDKDISDTRKILNVCRPWNYVRMVVYEGGLEDYSEYYNKIARYQLLEYLLVNNYTKICLISSLYFEEPELKGNKDIELIKNNIPTGILPCRRFMKNGNQISGSFRKKGCLGIWIEEDKVRLIAHENNYYSYGKGYYTYTYNNIQEALPMINKIIGEMGYV